MRRTLPSGFGLLCAAFAMTAICAGALAYFSTEGIGTATAGVSKLSAPTITAATPAAGGTVALTWSAVTAPNGASASYYVRRNNGEAAGNCPTSASPQAVTTCTDSGLAVGTYEYTVTAVFRSWIAASGIASAKVTVGPATHFLDRRLDHDPRGRRLGQPDDHRPGRKRQHRHHLHRLP